jgi:hypothetical protein
MRGLCVPLPQPGGPTRIVRDGARERQKMRRSNSARMAYARKGDGDGEKHVWARGEAESGDESRE